MLEAATEIMLALKIPKQGTIFEASWFALPKGSSKSSRWHQSYLRREKKKLPTPDARTLFNLAKRLVQGLLYEQNPQEAEASALSTLALFTQLDLL
jgi:hypothetical protein